MAEVLKITDGASDTVDLLGTADVKGWTPEVPQDESNLHEIVRENMSMRIQGTSQDNLASQLQTLKKLLRRANQFETTTWQNTPIYLEQQGSTESNPQYALLVDGKISKIETIHKKVPRDAFAVTAVLELWHEAGWRDAVPGVAGSAKTLTATDGSASPTHLFVANYTDDHSLTHIYNEDDSEGTFGDNEIAETTFNYFDVASATPVAADVVNFGSTEGTFHSVVMKHGGGAATYVIIWEYSVAGPGWSTLAEGANIQAIPGDPGTFFFRSTVSPGLRAVGITDINDWIAIEINGVTAHWIRARISSVTSHSDYITQDGQVVYVQKKNYIDIPNTVVNGDLPPHTMLSHLGSSGSQGSATPDPSVISKILFGARSVGLGTFTNEIVFDGTDMDTITGLSSWQRTLAAGVTSVADPDAPGGARINVAFSTDPTLLVTRAKMTCPDNGVVPAFRGEFQAFLRCQQISGAVGDCSVQLAIRSGEGIDLGFTENFVATDEVTLAAADAGIELVDLGIINIPSTRITSNDSTTNDLAFDVFAKRSTGSSTLRIYSIIIMPVNESAGAMNAPVVDTGEAFQSLQANGHLEMDSGVIIPRLARGTKVQDITAVTIQLESLEGFWELHGRNLILEPSTRYQIYYLSMQYNTAFGTGPFLSPTGMILGIELRTHDRYATLRGGD